MAGYHKGGSDANQINKMFTAVYEDKLTAFDHIESLLENRFSSSDDWQQSETGKFPGKERHEDVQKHILKEYPKQALECYKLVDVYRDYRADTKEGCKYTEIEILRKGHQTLLNNKITSSLQKFLKIPNGSVRASKS